jgi:tetratricopeptide (TPR) repeat protein
MRSDAEERQTAAAETHAQATAETNVPRAPIWKDSVFRQARAAHERGSLAEAERGYNELLATDPEHAEALHMLGVLRFQEEKLPDAEALIRRSIDRRASPLALANHAAVLANLGRREEALEDLDAALRLNPTHPRALLQAGQILVELGRSGEALDAYDRLLAGAPTFVDGLCQRSALLRSLGRFQEALASCDQALTIDNRSFDTLKERGSVLQGLGRHEDAIEAFGRALAMVPGRVDVLSMRGVCYLNLGRLDFALTDFNEALAGSPDFVDAMYNSAVVLERLGRSEEALGRCDRVLAVDPHHARALANRGNALCGLARNVDAVQSYAKALAIEPDAIEVLCNHSSALRRVGKFDEALSACIRALALKNDHLPARFEHGRVMQESHQYEEALADFDYVLAATPDNRVAHLQRGAVLTAFRRHAEAKQAYADAIAVDPDYVLAHCVLAFLCLSVGDFKAGWDEYEWRWRDIQMSDGLREFSQPRWSGVEPIAGKTILLHAEQGLGDTLQFCRYVPIVKALGGTVVLEAPHELKHLLETLEGVDVFVDRGLPLPPFDLHCPLLSLPRALHTELATIPNTVPYMQADPERIAKWRSKLGASTRPRIGLVWSGNPKHLNDRNRSMPLTSLLPLMTDAFEWISLHKVVREEDAEALALSPLRHFGDELVDFSDTAALLKMVDCVLSVDTSVAHLAGALGNSLWVLLPYTPDFRWLLDREDSPWYPQARLFRQSQPGDWAGVVKELESALLSLVPAARLALPT